MKIKFDDLNTWGILATFVGLIISIVTLIVANNVRKVTQQFQNSIAFDKRVPGHLKEIAALLTNFNILLNNCPGNVNQIKALLALIKGEILSLKSKITDKRTKKLISKVIKGIDRNINKDLVIKTGHSRTIEDILNYLFKVSEDDYWQCYTVVGEIHRTIDNLYKDKKATVKP